MIAQQDFEEVRTFLSKGAKILVARDSYGRHRIKLKTGPFGLLTKRYMLTHEQMERLRQDFHLDHG